jgi:hypothetical protein
MKLKTLFLSGLIFPTVFCFAQAQADSEAEIPKSKTKLASVSLREGVIIAKKYEDIAKLKNKGFGYSGTGNLEIKFITLSDAVSGRL